jgi:acyl-CoA thioesterase-1
MIRAGAVVFLILTSACAPADRAPEPERRPAATSAPVTSAPVASRPRIVALGDSLTAGLGLSPAEAYPALLQARLDREGLRYEVVNAGVSGDTSAGGLRRVDWALEGDVKVLIVALGGNDALRGLPIEQLRDNLAEIITRAKRRGIKVILAGMEAPPNYGPEYTAAFRQTYQNLARTYNVTLIPFLLQGVAGDPALNQGDGIHPNARGAQRVADVVWAALEPAVAKDRARR